MSNPSTEAIQKILTESVDANYNQIYEQRNKLNNLFVQATEQVLLELFASPTLSCIFEFGQTNNLNDIVKLILGILLITPNYFYKLKNYIEESKQQFNLFFSYLRYLEIYEVNNFYQQVLRQIRFDNDETCMRLCSLFITQLGEMQDFSSTQNLADLLHIIIVKRNMRFNIHFMCELSHLLSPRSSLNRSTSEESERKRASSIGSCTFSVIGLSQVVPQLYEIAVNSIHSQHSDAASMHESVSKSSGGCKQIYQTKGVCGSEMLKCELSDEEENQKEEDSVFQKRKDVSFAKSPKLPKLPPEIPSIPSAKPPELNLDPFDGIDDASKEQKDQPEQSQSQFFVRESSMESLCAEDQNHLRRFIESVHQYILRQSDMIASFRKIQAEQFVNFLLLMTNIRTQNQEIVMLQFFQKIQPSIEKIYVYATLNRGTVIGYVTQILICYVKWMKKLPFSQNQLLDFQMENKQIFQQSLDDIVQKFYFDEFSFCQYIKNSGFIPFKRRSPQISMICAIIREHFMMNQKSLSYEQKQEDYLNLFFISEYYTKALWQLGQCVINSKSQYSASEDILRSILLESPLKEEYFLLLDKLQVSEQKSFKYNCTIYRTEKPSLKIAPKYNNMQFSIQIGGKDDASSESQDEQFNQQYQQIITKRNEVITQIKPIEDDLEMQDEEFVEVGRVDDLAKRLREEKKEEQKK